MICGIPILLGATPPSLRERVVQWGVGGEGSGKGRGQGQSWPVAAGMQGAEARGWVEVATRRR